MGLNLGTVTLSSDGLTVAGHTEVVHALRADSVSAQHPVGWPNPLEIKTLGLYVLYDLWITGNVLYRVKRCSYFHIKYYDSLHTSDKSINLI